MHISVTDQISLTEFRISDKPALVRHLAEKEIYDRTLRIPYPYTEADADAWFEIDSRATEQHGGPVHWAIRDPGGALIGCVGFDGLTKGHRAEIGYWLAKPYWGRGIISAVVAAACAYALAEWKLVRITAHVFAFNTASTRVLEKNGFELEGELRKHYRKDGRLLDAKLYALVR
jgi:RimJ/RimL family protein N-acetyltransferase